MGVHRRRRLFASPRFHPDEVGGRGTFVADWPQGGVALAAHVRPRFRPVTSSYCLDNDPVCAFSALNLITGTSTHTGGYDPATDTGTPILADAAGLLAWGVEKRRGGDAPAEATGELAAYRQDLANNVRVSAAGVYARGAPTSSFAWDFTNDGIVDLATSRPWVTHGYGVSINFIRPPRTTTKVHITHANGHVTTRTICIRKVSFGSTTC